MITCHIIKTKDDLTECQNLLKRVYRDKNYYTGNGNASATNLETTTTFVAKKDNQICGTISLIKDSPAGLPMDSIFKTELDKIRIFGGLLAEVGSFAILDSFTQEKSVQANLIISFALLSSVVNFVIKNENLTQLCIAINPKHKGLYESLGFISIGTEKIYPQVNNAPAVAYYLDTQLLLNNPPPALKKLVNYHQSEAT